MSAHRASLEQWHEVVSEVIADGNVEAVPGILVYMALDGWGHEAEELRRTLIEATRWPSLKH